MTELVVRVVAGVHTLAGLGLGAAGVSSLAEEAPQTVLGWAAAVLGACLVAVMVLTGLRLALGEPVRPSRAAVWLLATLLGGLTGAFWMQLPASDVGR